MPLLSTFGAASARGFGNLSGILLPDDNLFNTVSFLSHFEGSNNGTNNSFDDSSTSNHTITASGNVTQGSFGPFARPDGEWGVIFDGAGDYLSAPNSSDWALGDGDFTIEAWVYAQPSGTVKQAVIGHWTNSSRGWQARIEPSGSGYKLRWTWTTNGSTDSSSTGTIVADFSTWNHVAWVRSGSTITMYVNGVAGGTVAGANIYAPNTPLVIGDWDSNAADFNGVISNLRLVKGTAVYTGNFTPSTSPLTAVTNTKLLTCQSNRFVDNSTSDHTITASGNAAVSAFGSSLTRKVYNAGVNGASAYFDGSGDWLVASSGSTDFGFGTDDFTMEFWINPNTVSSQGVLSMLTSASDTAPHIYLENTLRFYDGGGDRITSSTIAVGQWYHVAVCRSSSSTKMFINGVQAGSTYSDSNNYGTSKPCVVGSYYSSGSVVTGSTANSIISDVRIVKGTAVYTSNFTPPTAPLTAVTNTKLLLNMADGQAIDSAAQRNLSLENGTNISTAQAKFGNSSLYFDGTTDTATVIGSENVNFGTANFTVEGWIRPASFSGYKPNIISKWTNGSRGWAVRLVASGSGFVMRFTFSTDGSNDFSLDATTVLAFDTWHHFAFVQNSNTVTCYSNGTANGTISCSTIFASTNPIILGDWDSNQADYNGYIDDIRVTTGFARYTSNFTAPTEPFADKGQ